MDIEVVSNNKRIVKNSIFLLSRTAFLTLVTLYTLREVMSIIGAEGFGLYTVVFGVVAMFAFVNSAMMSATQRYLSIAIGRNEIQQVRDTFYCSLLIHLVLAILLVAVIYLLKDYFLDKVLNVEGYQREAIVIYHLAIFSVFVSLLQVPFSALITAYEKMQAFAYLAIFEGIAKLIVVYLLVFFDYNKVVMYSVFLMVISVILFLMHILYCYINFKQVVDNINLKIVKIKSMIKGMMNFIGWSLIGNLSIVMRNQGTNILLNMFFGLVVNAAFAISLTVMAAISTLVASVSNAINPQIFKLYAENNLGKFYNLIINGTRYYIYLLSLIITPLIFFMEFILNFWLLKFPDHTILFCQLMLILVLFDSLSILLTTGIQAHGKIKGNQIVTGLLLCLPIPITYYLFTINFPVDTVFYNFILVSILSIFTKLYYICNLTKFSFLRYNIEVLLPSIVIVSINFMLMYIVRKVIGTPSDFYDFVLASTVFVFLGILVIFLFGLSFEEKGKLKIYFLKKLGKKLN